MAGAIKDKEIKLKDIGCSCGESIDEEWMRAADSDTYDILLSRQLKAEAHSVCVVCKEEFKEGEGYLHGCDKPVCNKCINR